MRERPEMCRRLVRACLNVYAGAVLATASSPWSRSHELAVSGEKRDFIYLFLYFILYFCYRFVCEWLEGRSANTGRGLSECCVDRDSMRTAALCGCKQCDRHRHCQGWHGQLHPLRGALVVTRLKMLSSEPTELGFCFTSEAAAKSPVMGVLLSQAPLPPLSCFPWWI